MWYTKVKLFIQASHVHGQMHAKQTIIYILFIVTSYNLILYKEYFMIAAAHECFNLKLLPLKLEFRARWHIPLDNDPLTIWESKMGDASVVVVCTVSQYWQINSYYLIV